MKKKNRYTIQFAISYNGKLRKQVFYATDNGYNIGYVRENAMTTVIAYILDHKEIRMDNVAKIDILSIKKIKYA